MARRSSLKRWTRWVSSQRISSFHFPPKTAIARVERLYPEPLDELRAEIGRYPNLKEIRWVQDEPANMGPSPHYRLNVFGSLDHPVKIISRPASSSPSVGQHSRHVEENKGLMSSAFADLDRNLEDSY